MQFTLDKNLKRPIIILVILIIGFFLLLRLRDNLNYSVSAGEVEKIDKQLQSNYDRLQKALFSRVWESKDAILEDAEVARCLSLNERLLSSANLAAKKYGTRLNVRYLMLIYMYKLADGRQMMGFLGFDSGVKLIRPDKES